MANECHPIWKHFALRQFGAGDSAADLLRRYPPQRRQEFGRYGIYDYWKYRATGLRVIAKDGKLTTARAGSCTWEFCFFQTNDAEIDKQYEAFVKERHIKLERERMEKLETNLQVFYSQNGRWPTNEEEFSFYAPPEHHYSTNDLGIMIVQRPDGNVDFSSLEMPDEKRVVARPGGRSP